MSRGDDVVGVIHREPGPGRRLQPAEIALIQTFADQAVIAIENVRLLTELQARTAELTRSVEQLTALGEVGRAVSSSVELEDRPPHHRDAGATQTRGHGRRRH